MEIKCTCKTKTELHTIDCLVTAADEPAAMVDDLGDVFYPDSPQDAEHFREEYGAKPLNPEAYEEWEKAFG